MCIYYGQCIHVLVTLGTEAEVSDIRATMICEQLTSVDDQHSEMDVDNIPDSYPIHPTWRLGEPRMQ